MLAHKKGFSESYCVNNIISLIHLAFEEGDFICTPSHIDININEDADYFAKAAGQYGAPLHLPLSVSDGLKCIQNY